MAQCQNVSEKGSTRPPLKRTRRQPWKENDEKYPARASKRNSKSRNVDLRQSPRSDDLRGGSQPMVEHASTHTRFSRSWDGDDFAYMSESECNWSNASTVCSTEDHNAASPFTRGRWRSTCPELGCSGTPSDSKPTMRPESDLRHTGAWIECEIVLLGDKHLLFDDESLENHPPGLDAPDLGNLATPHLSPMPSTFEFCYCCDDDQDADRGGRVNKSLRLCCGDKSDARLEWALGYLEQKRRKD
ncbi:uncharacterized protein G6M90_00g026480 [Metarhizium brunneum]|uniref:Uncharacterized protein n=1 Tax=Metarhizium brunneum TaxID=500148 RepID=A0A7D5YTX6_9HYPO|nr:hypothetical protein G6M90_00g026480 [Metarhizium brunneum]